MTLSVESIFQKCANWLFILNDKHASGFGRGAWGYRHRGRSRCRLMSGQNDFKPSSLTRLTADQDLTTMIFNDTMRRRKTEAGATFTFGRVKRFKDTRNNFRWHAHTCIRDGKARTASLGARANFDTAALRHCIYRIED